MSEMPRTWDVEVLTPITWRVQAETREEALKAALGKPLLQTSPKVIGVPQLVGIREVGRKELSNDD